MTEPRYEFALIEAALLTPIEMIKKEDNKPLEHFRIECKIDEEDVSTSAFGLIYTLSLLSFRDARGAGYSETQFIDNDDWLALDMLSKLEFNSGGLLFYADYVRGRRMKTTITMNAEGILIIETSGRGSSVERWVLTVQGKKVISVIKGGKE